MGAAVARHRAGLRPGGVTAMASGPVDAAWMSRTALREGFDLDVFEQAWRIAHLLGEIGAHGYLRGRLALKGGTCINLFHTDLPRLSVDIDLNYIGGPGKDKMLAERPEVELALRALAREHGYEPEDIRRSYAGWTARLVYEGVQGARSSIKADLNYLMRVPLYGVELLPVPGAFDLGDARAPCLALEDVYGGKLKAMAVRAEPRDVYDAAQLYKRNVAHDSERLRRAFLFYAFVDDATLSTVDLDAVKRLTAGDYAQRLHPVLRLADRPSPEELLGIVMPRVELMLQLSDEERAFGKRLEAGSYEPGLLFRGVDVSDAIDRHPAAEWRRLHPHGRLPSGP